MICIFTPCLSTPTESSPDSSPVKICFIKSLSDERPFNFFNSLTTLHNLVHAEERSESLIVPTKFSNVASVDFDITSLILPWGSALSGSQQSTVTFRGILGWKSWLWQTGFHFSLLTFYDELGSWCYLIKVLLVKTVFMKDSSVIMSHWQVYQI